MSIYEICFITRKKQFKHYNIYALKIHVFQVSDVI